MPRDREPVRTQVSSSGLSRGSRVQKLPPPGVCGALDPRHEAEDDKEGVTPTRYAPPPRPSPSNEGEGGKTERSGAHSLLLPCLGGAKLWGRKTWRASVMAEPCFAWTARQVG